MNTASRLEGANKGLETAVLASSEALAAARAPGYRAMGRILVRGRSAPLDVFEAAPDFPEGARTALNDACRAFLEGDASALAVIEGLATQCPDDRALQNLVVRLRSTGPSAAYCVQ